MSSPRVCDNEFGIKYVDRYRSPKDVQDSICARTFSKFIAPFADLQYFKDLGVSEDELEVVYYASLSLPCLLGSTSLCAAFRLLYSLSLVNYVVLKVEREQRMLFFLLMC